MLGHGLPAVHDLKVPDLKCQLIRILRRPVPGGTQSFFGQRQVAGRRGLPAHLRERIQERVFGLGQLLFGGKHHFEIQRARYAKSRGMHYAGIDVYTPVDPGGAQGLLQLKRCHLGHHIEMRTVRMPDGRDEIAGFHAGRQFGAPPEHPAFSLWHRLHRADPHRLGRSLHRSKIVLHQRHHIFERHPPDEDERGIVRHEVSFVEISLVGARVLVEIGEIALRPENRVNDPCRCVEGLVVRRTRTVEVAVALFD